MAFNKTPPSQEELLRRGIGAAPAQPEPVEQDEPVEEVKKPAPKKKAKE
jgi:hypothetical protein